MAKIKDLKGKKVYAKNGMLIGQIEDVELNDTTWAVDTITIKVTDEVSKLFDVKGGFMTKSLVPLPVSLFGEVEADRVTLKETIKDVNSLREYVKTQRAVM